jgi:hypothetical protein
MMVFTSQILDSLPILGVFVAFAIVSLLFYEGGFKFGRWYQERTPGEQEGPTNLLVSSILALSPSSSARRDDGHGLRPFRCAARDRPRRGEFDRDDLPAGRIPAWPASSQIRELLREYVPLRIVVTDAKAAKLAMDIQRSQEISQPAVDDLRGSPRPPTRVTSSPRISRSLNETIDLNETRISGRALCPRP